MLRFLGLRQPRVRAKFRLELAYLVPFCSQTQARLPLDFVTIIE